MNTSRSYWLLTRDACRLLKPRDAYPHPGPQAFSPVVVGAAWDHEAVEIQNIGHIVNVHTAMTHGPAGYDARLYIHSLPHDGGSSGSTTDKRKFVTADLPMGTTEVQRKKSHPENFEIYEKNNGKHLDWMTEGWVK